jgi:hypothetical protein
MAFTDIDASLAFETSIKAIRWAGRRCDRYRRCNQRPVTRPSRLPRSRGRGILIGDGQLNYSHERVLNILPLL